MKTEKPKQWLRVRSKKEWSDWLKDHHENTDEIWLQINKTHTSLPGLKLSEAVTEAIRYGWIDSRMYAHDDDSYILRFTPRRSNSVWSAINRKRAEKLIEEKKMKPTGSRAVEQAKASGNWQKAYSSKEPPVIPNEIREQLKNEGLFDIFSALPASHQLRYLTWIDQAKWDETRQARIRKMITMIKDDEK